MSPVGASPRPAALRTQLTLAFVLIAVLAAGLVGAWARYIFVRQSAAFLARIQQGDLPAPPEGGPPPFAPPPGAAGPPPRLARAQAGFERDMGRSLLLGGGTAAVLAIVLGAVLAQRLARPLRQAEQAAAGIAAGNYEQRIAVQGPGEVAGMAEAFNAMAARLAADEQMRREFLAAVAHELRTPLSIIQAYVESFLDGVAEPSPEHVTILSTQAEILNRLITDLRDVSLAEAGQLALHRQDTDLAALWQETVETMQPWIDEHGVRVAVSRQGRPTAAVDPDRMRQVIQNLLHNAIRHTPPGGAVQVTVARAPGAVEMTVEDEGPGIQPEDLPRIFEAFFRGDPARARDTGGTGLGLAVVKRLIEAHGGTVSAENRPERGTRFAVRVPQDGGAQPDRPAGA